MLQLSGVTRPLFDDKQMLPSVFSGELPSGRLTSQLTGVQLSNFLSHEAQQVNIFRVQRK